MAYSNNYRGQKRSSQNQRTEFKAKSGASSGIDKNGKPYVSGWMVRRRQMISLFASPYKGTHEVKTQNGRIWHTWILKIVNKDAMTETVRPCLYDPSTKRVFCQDLDIMLSPNTKRRMTNGKGYAGSYLKG